MRSELANAKRIVVKLGTGVLTDAQKRPDPAQFTQLVKQVASLRAEGRGAVARGDQRPAHGDALAELLALHAGKLVSRTMIYEHLFAEDDDSLSNLVEVYVHSLRRKLGRGAPLRVKLGIDPTASDIHLGFACGVLDRLDSLIATLPVAALLWHWFTR